MVPLTMRSNLHGPSVRTTTSSRSRAPAGRAAASLQQPRPTRDAGLLPQASRLLLPAQVVPAFLAQPAPSAACSAAATIRGCNSSSSSSSSRRTHLRPARVQATPDGPQQPADPSPSGQASLAEVQQVIREVLGAQYCLKESAVSATEVKRLPSLGLVRSRVAGLKDEFGIEAAAKLLSSSLCIMEADPLCVRERLGVVAAACGCDMESALELCTRHKGAAATLRFTPGRLELAFATLEECLGLQTEDELHQLCRKNTRMLLVAPSALKERHTKLGDVLRLDSKQLADLLQRSPDLLRVAPDKVKAGVEAVRAGLELGSWEEAVQVATRTSDLLRSDPKRTVEVVRWLKQRLELSSSDLEKYTILFMRSEAQLEQHLAGLPAALGIPPADVLLLAKAAPKVLLVPAATVGKGWVQLKAAAGMQPRWRAQLLAYSAASAVMLLATGEQRLSTRIQQVVAAAPAAEHLPSLSALVNLPEPKFQELMGRVRNGTFKAQQKPPAVTPASIAVACPCLAAQL